MSFDPSSPLLGFVSLGVLDHAVRYALSANWKVFDLGDLKALWGDDRQLTAFERSGDYAALITCDDVFVLSALAYLACDV